MTTGRCTHALVTGGAGFIGSHLGRRLLADGLAVTVLDDLSTGVRSAVDPGARFICGDVRSQADVLRALEGVDCVFHLAAKVTVRGSFANFYEDIETNLLGTSNLLRCLSPGSVRRFIFASTMAVYADAANPTPIDEAHPQAPMSPYGIGKMASEMLCAQVLSQLEIPLTVVRYFNTFGPGQRFTPYVGVITIFVTKLLRREAPVIFGDGSQRRDFVHVDDIVAGTVAALDGRPGTYNLGTGRATSVHELGELLAARIDPSATLAYAPTQPGELSNSIADISAAREHLGYDPKGSLDADIDALITYIRATLAARDTDD